uniref:Uncharacterized protein n=1 Tax=Acrobeloides nanus TaxID=290746 RepID=A0A914EDX6_9BILA
MENVDYLKSSTTVNITLGEIIQLVNIPIESANHVNYYFTEYSCEGYHSAPELFILIGIVPLNIDIDFNWEIYVQECKNLNEMERKLLDYILSKGSELSSKLRWIYRQQIYIALILKRLSNKETLQSAADAFELTISCVEKIQEACFTNGQAVGRFINALHQHCQWKYHIPRTVDKIDPKSNIETLSDNDKEKLNGIIKYMKHQVDDKNNQSSSDENDSLDDVEISSNWEHEMVKHRLYRTARTVRKQIAKTFHEHHEKVY